MGSVRRPPASVNASARNAFSRARYLFPGLWLRLLTSHSSLHTHPRTFCAHSPDAGITSITVTSGRAQNRTRGAAPPSIPIPRLTYIAVGPTR